jgi:hypothetical protein
MVRCSTPGIFSCKGMAKRVKAVSGKRELVRDGFDKSLHWILIGHGGQKIS